MNTQIDQLFDEVIQHAVNGVQNESKGPFAAAITGEGGTWVTSNSVTSTFDPTAHAEVNAIRAACAALETHDLTGYTLVTSCEPCPMCLTAALWARVSRIVFAATTAQASDAGFDDGYFYNLVNNRSKVIEWHAREDATAPFDAWAVQEDRTDY